jgi:Leucine-rich repeat (LRR) protein
VQRDEALQLYGGLDLSNQDIGDMTGIQAFSNIEVLDCSNNRITFLAQLPRLTDLMCENNLITEITADVTTVYYLQANNNKLTALPTLRYILHLEADHNELTSLQGLPAGQPVEVIRVGFNQIESVNLSDFIYVRELYLNDNLLTTLDASMAEHLGELDCGNNQLTMLNIRNGRNEWISFFNAKSNPDLTCIEVDDPAAAETNWRDNVDPQAVFSDDCGSSSGLCIAVSPNPTMGKLTIESSEAIDEVVIFDGLSGGLISSEKGNELDVSYLRSGLYFLKVRSGDKEITTRIVKE